MRAKTCNAATNGHRGQAAAIIESIVADGGNAVGDGHGDQAAATRESTVADRGDAVGDGHGGHAAATIEFTSLFVSMIYTLNGRKVTMQIMKRMKKMKI